MPRVKLLHEAIDKQHPGKCSITYNDPEQLAKYNPEFSEEQTWRKKSFEIIRTDTDAVLYSKLTTGNHLVDGKEDGPMKPFIEGLGALAE